MKKKIIQILLITMCVFLLACGKEKNEEGVMEDAMVEESAEDLVHAENQLEAQKIIELTAGYNTTDNIYTDEIGYEKSKEFILDVDDEEAYGLILEELEKETGSAHKQIEKFYEHIDSLFTEKCTTLELGIDDSVLFYYYHNLTKNYVKAYDWVASGAIGGGVNVHSSQEGASWSAGGDWIYYGEMTLYLPYYIYENLYTDKELSYDDMVNEIGFMDRSTSCLAQLDYENDYFNNNWAPYEYDVVRDYIPMLEPMMWMGREYDTFDGLAEHELIFSPSIVTPEDYWNYDWFNGTVNCAYVIHFYDKTADLYGEAGFTADNKIMGLSFWEEPGTVFWNTDKVKEEENKEADVAEKEETAKSEEVEQKETENTTTTQMASTENKQSTETASQQQSGDDTITTGGGTETASAGTSTGTGSGSASGGIVFVHEHTWQKMSQKIADAYTYQEIVQYGYSCGCCETVFDTYSEICPSCGAMCMNNNYVFEDRYVKDKYSEFEVCISCGSTRNVMTVEK